MLQEIITVVVQKMIKIIVKYVMAISIEFYMAIQALLNVNAILDDLMKSKNSVKCAITLGK